MGQDTQKSDDKNNKPRAVDNSAFSINPDPVLIRDEYIRVPSDLAHWNARLAITTANYLNAKRHAEQVEAAVSIAYREQYEMHGEKYTETKLREVVINSEEYQAARATLNTAEVERASVQGKVEAIRIKAQMLISLGATVRAENRHVGINNNSND